MTSPTCSQCPTCSVMAGVESSRTISSSHVEWFDYGGVPYHFRLIIPVDEATLDLTKHSTVLSLIAYYKNLRSVLDEVEYHGASSVGIVYAAAAFIGSEMIDGATAIQH